MGDWVNGHLPTFTRYGIFDRAVPVIVKKTAEVTEMVPASEFGRPPVFDGSCLIADDKLACSNKKIQEYIDEQSINYPDAAQSMKQEGLEYVTFTLDEQGKFEGELRVISKDKPCKGCADAAADIVASMEDMWFPAILDGKTVKTELTVPIRFDLINR
ncbi:MAG: energy transducer TonB [Phaeodactylibacter sp.]|nr:energy transducer TonB [Phaeodactylibacter sp.]MCB9276037.1 energy transducer TonB [Lewinellaceae bacterium]